MSENVENQALLEETRDDLDGRFLLFHINDRLYSLMLRYVIEIIPMQNITYLPGTAYYIKGVINIRGKVVPVISTRAKLNFPEQPYDDKTCIIVIEIQEMTVGLIVDSISDVIAADSSQMAAPPATGDTATRYLSSVTEIENQVILNLDCEKFLYEDLSEFAGI